MQETSISCEVRAKHFSHWREVKPQKRSRQLQKVGVMSGPAYIAVTMGSGSLVMPQGFVLLRSVLADHREQITAFSPEDGNLRSSRNGWRQSRTQ